MRYFSLLNFLFLLFLWLFTQCTSGPLKGVEVSSQQKQIPVLKYKDNNPVLEIKLEMSEKKTLTALEISTEGTSDLNDLSSVRVFYTGQDSSFSTHQQYAKGLTPAPALRFAERMELDVGEHRFWICYQVDEKANLLNFVDASLARLTFEKGGEVLPLNSDTYGLRLGVALRQHNDDQVHTHRIPGLTTTENGTLLAIYDARWNDSRDLQGDIDIGLSRSVDSGNTWNPMQAVLDRKEWGGLPERFNGVSDACILSDPGTGDIYIAGLWMHGVLDKNGKWIEGLTEKSQAWEHQWLRRGSQPGFDVKQTSQFLITKSTDDGLTWSEPVNLTSMCKKKEWWLWAPAPGRGIVMEDGTLVFPTQGRDENGEPFSNITYSRDKGRTWITSNPAYTNTTECAVVQLGDGSLMLNMRDNRNRKNKSATNGRAVFVTSDMGQTWIQHSTHHGALPEPTCMASLHKHLYEEGDEHVLIFSNPNSRYHRDHMTVKVSFDDGQTWPEKNWLLLDEGKGRGYSCLTSIDEKTIGIVYEGSQADLIFQQILLSDLIQPK